VYLLLFVSLIGCVVPRTRQHWRALRARPPAAPRNLSRLPVSRSYATTASAQEVLDAAERSLRRRRFRVDRRDGSVAAEKGYARETGNLVFHLALVVLLAGVAVGALYGTKGSAIVVEGSGFANTVTRYDSFSAGPLADPQRLDPFSFTLDSFTATYQRGGQQNGAPRSFVADVTVQDTPTSPSRHQVVQVNDPLVVGGTKVFLVGHGYAPVVTVRDGEGRVVFSDAVPFLPRDGMFTSVGVIKVPDARPTQLGFQGIFLPTASIDPVRGPVSTFPADDDPALFLSLWKGDLGLDTGEPQSVYRLDVSRMSRVGLKALQPGQSWTLPDGLGTITFDGVKQYAALSIARDPGKEIALGSVLVAIAGLLLSLFVPRRRVWVRATDDGDGTTLVEIGGLARTEAGGLETEVDTLRSDLPAAAPPAVREPIEEPR
jgi:cytochrome c biogenesis protein